MLVLRVIVLSNSLQQRGVVINKDYKINASELLIKNTSGYPVEHDFFVWYDDRIYF